MSASQENRHNPIGALRDAAMGTALRTSNEEEGFPINAIRAPSTSAAQWLKLAALLALLFGAGCQAAPTDLPGSLYRAPADGACQAPARLEDAGWERVEKLAATGGRFCHQAGFTVDRAGRYVLDFKNSSVIGRFRHFVFDERDRLVAELEGGIQSDTENDFFLRHGRELALNPGRYRLVTELASPFFLAQPRPYLETLPNYRQSIKAGNALVLTCLGVFLGLGVYYAALALVRRRVADGMYALFILGNLLYNGAALLVYPQLFDLHWFYLISAPILLSNCAYILFVIELLEIRRHSHPRLHRTGIALLGLLGGFVALAAMRPNWSLELDRYGVGLFLVYGLAAGMARARQGSVAARYYLVVISTFFALGAAAISQSQLHGTYTIYIEHLGLGAVTVEAVLLALVLSYQFAQLHREKEQALTLAEDSSRIASIERREKRVLDDIINGLPGLFYILDEEGRFVRWNQAVEEVSGYRADEMRRLSLPDFHAGDDKALMKDKARQAFIQGEAWAEAKLNLKNGRQIPYFFNTHRISIDGKPYLVGLGVDITERKKVEEALHESEERFRTIFEAAPLGIAVIDSFTGHIHEANPKFAAIAGRTKEELAAMDGMNITHPDDVQEDLDNMALLNTGKISGFSMTKRYFRPNGSSAWIHMTIAPMKLQDGSHLRHLCMVEDITEKKKADELIWNQANFDSLTGLPNRRMLLDRLDQEIKKSHRTGQALALMLLDIDRFKEINDTLGHDVGDELLKDAARRLGGCIRESDTVARLGGDEFAVLLGELDATGGIERIAQDILRKLAEPFSLNDEVCCVSTSIGITLHPDDAGSIDALLKNADQAMYAAKNQGGNRYCYFTPSMQEAALTRMRLINDLRDALVDHPFRAVYQPIVELATGAVHKAEALIRWQHPTRGLVCPSEFIHVAEETGMINDIGDWIFRETANQVRRWRTSIHAGFQISVNTSPVQFLAGRGHCAAWLAHLQELGLPGQAIVVEITEGLLLDANNAITEKLLLFRDAGVQVAIDDFGTGYSALSYLTKFDIDYIKIDQSFVRNLEHDASSMALCKAIIVMAHELGLKVIAEGVETERQRDLLAAADCDYGQGYLFAPPMSAEEFDKRFAAPASHREPRPASTH